MVSAQLSDASVWRSRVAQGLSYVSPGYGYASHGHSIASFRLGEAKLRHGKAWKSVAWHRLSIVQLSGGIVL
jgi:hypothetical protein